MKGGMSTITGRPATHLGSLHSRPLGFEHRHLFGKTQVDLLKLALRMSGSCSDIFCRPICRRCLVVGGTGGVRALKGLKELDGLFETDLAGPVLAGSQGLLLEVAVGR